MIDQIINRGKQTLSIFYLYLSIVGIFSFSLFIMEEAVQSIQFATFSTKDAQRWDLTKNNMDYIEKISGHMETINNLFLWIQPIQLWAYSDYINATHLYVKSIRAMVLANDPAQFEGEHLSISFYYKSVTTSSAGYKLRAGRIIYQTTTKPESCPIIAEGTMTRLSSNLFQIL